MFFLLEQNLNISLFFFLSLISTLLDLIVLRSAIQLFKISKNDSFKVYANYYGISSHLLWEETTRSHTYTIKQHRGVCRHLHRGVQYPLRSKGCFANPVVSFRFEYPLKLGLTSEQINSGLTLASFDWWHANRQGNFVVSRI